MTTIESLKSQAKRLRAHLSAKNIQLTHSQALEAVAAMHGHRDWNTASAAADDHVTFTPKSYRVRFSLDEFLGGDLGPAEVQTEGTYRRGYHQCAAEIMHAMRGPRPITAAILKSWVEGAGMEWRKDKPLNRMLTAPGFVNVSEEE